MPILPCFFLYIKISLLFIPLDNPRFVLPCFNHCYSNDQTVILSKSCDGFFFKFRENGRRVTPESNVEFLHEDTCIESPPGEISFSPLTTVGAQEDVAGKRWHESYSIQTSDTLQPPRMSGAALSAIFSHLLFSSGPEVHSIQCLQSCKLAFEQQQSQQIVRLSWNFSISLN